MIKTQKTRFAVLLLVLVTLFSTLFIPINATETNTSENFGIEEIMPRRAYGCYNYYIPDSWHKVYMDASMREICDENGWELGKINMNSSNERTQYIYYNGVEIGSYHLDHKDKSSGKVTQAHYHINSDEIHYHYLVYR